ncbi:MAG: hypothetical protein VB071_12320 [Lawsonibacter sp.]|nr:hypothetical protein [Lawsonibacter sp.]
MLDEQDLQAIDQLIQKRVGEAEQRIAKNTVILMDAEFSKQFNLLAEGIQDIQEKLIPRCRVDDLEDEVKFLKSIVRQMNEDIQTLKKAQ